MTGKKGFSILLAVFIIVFCCPDVYAAARKVKDGFRTARTMHSRHFDIEIESGVDLANLTMALSVPPSIRSIIRESTSFADSFTLPNELDVLYLAVSEIMDIHLGKYKLKVKICKDAESLSRVAELLYGQKVQVGGFYVLQIDTLYVDAENVTLNILGHELSHAIQCTYFVVPPPVKIQEVLAGYVEFQLRKYSDTLKELKR